MERQHEDQSNSPERQGIFALGCLSVEETLRLNRALYLEFDEAYYMRNVDHGFTPPHVPKPTPEYTHEVAADKQDALLDVFQADLRGLLETDLDHAKELIVAFRDSRDPYAHEMAAVYAKDIARHDFELACSVLVALQDDDGAFHAVIDSRNEIERNLSPDELADFESRFPEK